MHANLPHRFRSLTILAVISIVVVIAGCTPNVNFVATAATPDASCTALAEETIALSQQLLDTEDATGQIDNDLACRFLANEIQLVDDRCIAETDLPDGVDRGTLVLQQQDFNCLP